MRARHKHCGPKNCGPNRIFGPFGVFSAELEDILSNVLGEETSQEITGRKFKPYSNVAETEKGFVISLELPGLKIEQIDVEVHEGSLFVSGEKSLDNEDCKWISKERLTGTFKREFEFPTSVDFEKIAANFENGVLHIDVPKSEVAVPRKINIQSN